MNLDTAAIHKLYLEIKMSEKNPEQKYSPEPWMWKEVNGDISIGSQDNWNNVGEVFIRGDAERIVQCVNFCAGFFASELDRGQVSNLTTIRALESRLAEAQREVERLTKFETHLGKLRPHERHLHHCASRIHSNPDLIKESCNCGLAALLEGNKRTGMGGPDSD